MNILISRLILYVNTTMKLDIHYELAMYIIKNYAKANQMNIKSIMEDCFVSRASITRFCQLFGFDSWMSFHNELIRTQRIKNEQLKNRFLKWDTARHYQHLAYFCGLHEDDEVIQEWKKMIAQIVETISQSERIYLFGAIYPLSLCTEFQTNMISLGKVVYQDYQSHEDVHFEFTDKDFSIVLSATGRYVRECSKKFHQIYFSSSRKMMMTLSDQFDTLSELDYYIQFPQSHHMIDYNYFIMTFLEIVFMEYYFKYQKEKGGTSQFMDVS